MVQLRLKQMKNCNIFMIFIRALHKFTLSLTNKNPIKSSSHLRNSFGKIIKIFKGNTFSWQYKIQKW